MNPTDQSRFDDLLSWATSHGASLHPDVEIYLDPQTGYSLRIKPVSTPPHPPFTVVTCPAPITLSYLNALTSSPLPPSISSSSSPFPAPNPAFPPTFLSSLPPHVIGRFFLIQQYLLGPRSYWYPYIRTLPQPERISSWALPAFWPEEDVEFLEGTNAEVAVEETRENVKREWKEGRRVLKEQGWEGWRDYSRVLHNWAFCMFTSRSFRPSTIFSSDFREGLRRAGVLGEGVKDDDFSVLMPVLDIGNHDLRAEVEWDTQGEGGVRWVMKGSVERGGQVCNNYGRKTNGELLLGYGFVIPEAEAVHNDYVHLRKRGEVEGEGKKDFLVGLRPMRDGSSVVGRKRMRVRWEEGEEVLPGLANVEDGLVWDLVVALAAGDEEVRGAVERLMGDSADGGDVDYILKRILSAPTATELEGLVDKVKEALLAKLAFDYERILDPEVYEDGEPALVPTNANQELAMAYRGQCKRVLETVIRALGGQIDL